jgi:transcriptional regulator GlxA family with amidase domain
MPIWTKNLEQPITINFLLIDQFSNNSLGNCLEPLRACNAFDTKPVFEWQFLTLDGKSVQSSSGLPILPDGAISDMTRCDYLWVNSSYGYEKNDTSKTRIALQKASKLAKTMVGLDTGAWLIAAAGLLNGKTATIHWDILDSFTDRFPSINVERKRVVEDKNRITCAGAMSSFDLALLIISKHLGQSSKVDLEAFFMHQGTALVADTPLKNVRDPLLNKALELMHKHMENPLSRDTLAHRVSCQVKTLDRRFIAEFGVPAGQIYRHIRLSAAQQMVTSTSLSIFEISLRTGFQNPSAMTRAYKTRFGVTPSQSRLALDLS